ncbi:hypothetical protein M9H77_23709 [Catharanthus roseus]|uniref:Uncharacterized protein n=1 Tax=Catharanthus roseus TaxID=4058 RepID=A0ACC0AUU7_CATRO|nr:hypothetical protein M9H77_23709 [Catharanthus roseus]
MGENRMKTEKMEANTVLDSSLPSMTIHKPSLSQSQLEKRGKLKTLASLMNEDHSCMYRRIVPGVIGISSEFQLDNFNKHSAYAKLITEIIKEHFVEAHASFGKILGRIKSMWYTKFGQQGPLVLAHNLQSSPLSDREASEAHHRFRRYLLRRPMSPALRGRRGFGDTCSRTGQVRQLHDLICLLV